MFNKLLILLIVILILAAFVIFGILGAILPWSTTRSDQSTTGGEAYDATQAAMPTLVTLPVSTGMPANPSPSQTSVKGQLSSLPVCFSTEEPIPFAFTPEATKLLVRARSGVQIFDLESGTLDAFIHSSKEMIAAVLSPDGQVLAWSVGDNTIQLLRISDHKILHTLSGHTDMVTKLRFSPNWDFLVSGISRQFGQGLEYAG